MHNLRFAPHLARGPQNLDTRASHRRNKNEPRGRGKVMKKWECFLIGVTLLVVSWTTGAWARNSQVPEMVIDKAAFDAGETLQGNVVGHSFKILNRGNGVLEIIRVDPG